MNKKDFRIKYLMILFIWTLNIPAAKCQDTSKAVYNPNDLFPAIPIYPSGNTFRTATGEPGRDYWQNRVDYSINVSLDDVKNVIAGTEIISYTNSSPKGLQYLWLNLEQNAFRQNSKALQSKLFLDSNEIKTKHVFDGGFEIISVELLSDEDLKAKSLAAKFLIDDTRMQLFLPQSLLPDKKAIIKINYKFKIPRYFYNADFNVNRTDILPTKNGNIYSIAQWYPRLCVLDDVEGWNTLPYLGNGEFYLEYGNFHVNITLPSEYIVAASGELLNPGEVLTASQLKRWKQAQSGNQKVFIRTPDEVSDKSSRPSKPNCTWKFKIENSRDFAWTASKAFIWEGIKINLPEGEKAFGMSLYPVESNKSDSWQRSSEYVKFTIEHFSEKWYPYPYPYAVNVASNLDGMEYPGIVFCPANGVGNGLWSVTKHELGHTWFPMIVGSNERKYAWMDEGFNTFIDNLADPYFNHNEFKGYLAHSFPPETYFADSLSSIVTRPDALKNGSIVWTTQYMKTAYLLRLLRDQIVGPQHFDFAFKKYIHDWAFKHPTPWDFFRSINNSTGEDLTWFWKSMFLENYKLDQAITEVAYINNDPAKGANIFITNFEKAAMPVTLEITTSSGKKEKQKLPVEIWEHSDHYVYKTTTAEKIVSAVIDPEHVFPDVNRANNSWQ